jgi:hypothetical protein
MKTYTYHCIHIETKKMWLRTVECQSRLEFLELLNFWNKSGVLADSTEQGSAWWIFWE